MNISTLSVGFLGAGRMATALASGFCAEGLVPNHLTAVDPFEPARTAFADALPKGIRVGDDSTLLSDCDLIFLAVKPQVMASALEEVKTAFGPQQLIVSIAAGIDLRTLEEWLPDRRIVRVMPNTPCLVGEGACGISPGSSASEDDAQTVAELLSCVGIVEQIPERLMDALTGLSGSGPAYVFQMIEALSDGGVKMGLPRPTATRLAAQTLLGSAKMVLQTGDHPGSLKDAVTSPGGTTIAGIHALEKGGLRSVLINAVQASAERSAELG